MVKRKATFGHRKATQSAPFPQMPEKKALERRQSLPRKVQLRKVRLIYNNGFSTSDAILRSLSNTGAKIEVNNPLILPDRFTMMSSNGDIHVKCRRVWRNRRYIGLQFEP